VALFGISTIYPKGRYADVFTVAKRDIEVGRKLDGIGGYDCYGLVERADIVQKEDLLPMGLAEYATALTKIKKDTPITYDMVDVADNEAFKLRKEQEKFSLPKML